MNDQTLPNPLLCDPETGVCALPGSQLTAAADHAIAATQKAVRVIYFTDPICSTCWGVEPQLRKLKLEYGTAIDITHHMGGLLPSWDIYNSGGISKPSDVAHHWEEVGAHYQMPIDGDVWLEDPLPSSYPPSVAYKAAAMQDTEKADLFLRRIREMVFLEKKNITRWDHLVLAAQQVGLDTAQFKKDVEGQAPQLFQDDLLLGKQLGVRGFPTLFFSNAQNDQLMVYGFKPYEQFEQAVLALAPQAVKQLVDTTPAALFHHYPTLTTREFAVLSNNTMEAALNILQDQLDKGVITMSPSKNGPLWIAHP
jgi:putative protein-disulfide isomerase